MTVSRSTGVFTIDDKTLISTITGISGGASLIFILAAIKLRRRLRGIAFTAATFSLIVATVSFWYTHRPLPTDDQRALFDGIDYIRRVQQEPFAQIVHVVRIDLTHPRIEFIVTPRTPVDAFEMAARTTSAFLREFDTQVAINGDFFDPWFEYGFFNYYPHTGDGINLRGYSATGGATQTEGYSQNFATLNIMPDNTVTIGAPDLTAQVAISGYLTPVTDGEITLPNENNSYLWMRHPRTAIAVDRAGETLLLIVVDGRQPNYSEGATLEELAAIILEFGGWNALNLDGGGSSTLVIEGENGEPLLLNSPIHGRVPGLERSIGNHFGVRISN